MNAPTEVITTTCQEDGGTVPGCVHYHYRGETVDSHELGLRQAEQRLI